MCIPGVCPQWAFSESVQYIGDCIAHVLAGICMCVYLCLCARKGTWGVSLWAYAGKIQYLGDCMLAFRPGVRACTAVRYTSSENSTLDTVYTALHTRYTAAVTLRSVPGLGPREQSRPCEAQHHTRKEHK